MVIAIVIGCSCGLRPRPHEADKFLSSKKACGDNQKPTGFVKSNNKHFSAQRYKTKPNPKRRAMIVRMVDQACQQLQ